MGIPNEGGGKAPEAAKSGPSTASVAPTTAPAGVAGDRALNRRTAVGRGQAGLDDQATAAGTQMLVPSGYRARLHLQAIDTIQVQGRGKKAQKLRPLAGTGLRDRKHQAKLFFDKVMSTGGRPGFWSDEPIYVDPETDAVVDGPDKGRRLEEDEWRHPKYVGIRVDRALKYSALPSVSRHHWGTDVDVQSVTSKDWKAGGEGTPEGRYHQLSLWLEANREVLPLKTTFSGERHGGYLDEEWHLSMRALGPAMHARFNALLSRDEIVSSILAAFDEWPSEDWSKGVTRANTRDELRTKLLRLDISSFVDGVNPDVAPGEAE